MHKQIHFPKAKKLFHLVVIFQVRQLLSVVIPMREITLVEKVETSAIIPNAVHITAKSKVSICLCNKHWVCLGSLILRQSSKPRSEK